MSHWDRILYVVNQCGTENYDHQGLPRIFHIDVAGSPRLSSLYIFIYSLFHLPFWQPWALKSSLSLLKWFVSDVHSEFLSFVKHVIFSPLFFEFHFIIFRSIFVVLLFFFCLIIRFSCYFLELLDCPMQFPFEAISFDVALVSTEEAANFWAVFL